MKNKLDRLVYCLLIFVFTGCGLHSSDVIDPFYEYGEEEERGQRNNLAILHGGASKANSGGGEEERARRALQVIGEYDRAHDPQPYRPVLRPAEVRLMWIPDHLNRYGDLIPAHYYYLRILPERWRVRDTFDVDKQLDVDDGGIGGATPWVYK